jgi:hypothetical protein
MKLATQTTEGDNVSTEPHQEALGTMLGKLGLVWVGFFAGMSLKDLLQIAVLAATLIYTVIQIWITFRDKILRDRAGKQGQQHSQNVQ